MGLTSGGPTGRSEPGRGLLEHLITAEPARTAPGGAALRAIVLCCLVAMLDGADSQALAIAAPLVARDLAIGSASLGFVFSASLAGAALGSVAAGVLSDRFGPRRVLASCAALMGIMQIATAFSSSLPGLVTWRVLAGVGLGGAAPCFLALAAGHSAVTHRAKILSLVWACFPVGALVGGAVNGWLVANWSWQAIFLFGGTPALLLAPVIASAVADARPDPVSEGGEGAYGLNKLLRTSGLREPMLLLCLIFFGTFALLAETVAWVPTLMGRNGLPPFAGGAALSMHSLGALVSLAAGGFVLQRFGVRMLTVALVASAVLLLILSLLLSTLWPAVFLMLLIGLSLGFAAAGAIGLSGTLFPDTVRSTSVGLGMSVAQVAQMLILLTVGLALQSGLSAALTFQLSAVLLAISAGAALTLERLTARAGS